MKIVIANGGATVTLSDGQFESPSNFTVRGSRSVQIAAFLRANAVKTFYRGNRQTVVSFSIARAHKTVAQAELFIMEHELALPTDGDVYFYAKDAYRILKGAALSSVESTYIGSTTFHNYEITGGIFTLD